VSDRPLPIAVVTPTTYDEWKELVLSHPDWSREYVGADAFEGDGRKGMRRAFEAGAASRQAEIDALRLEIEELRDALPEEWPNG
jgi:hypothetical protein